LDVENLVKANVNTVMRIASISKPITCVIAAKLYEEGKLDFDKSIELYLPDLPIFKFNDKPVKITTRQLISHTSGIRHYEKKHEIKNDEKTESGSDTALKEFYIRDNFKNTKDALQLFINDELLSEPGNK
jgi:serine beta-lactamase-like protein LACTB, mitochondrial